MFSSACLNFSVLGLVVSSLHDYHLLGNRNSTGHYLLLDRTLLFTGHCNRWLLALHVMARERFRHRVQRAGETAE